jgi:chromosome segregation ATPase
MPVMDSEEEKLRAHLQEVVIYFRKRLADWEMYGKRSQAQAQRLIDRNRELTARVAELEGQLREVVRKAEPHNRQLFQSRNDIKKGK